MQEKFRKMQEIVEKELLCSAHSMDHVLRVREMCMHLADAESRKSLERKRAGLANGRQDIDMEVLEAAALLHDIARIKEDTDASGNTDHAALGSKIAGKVLKEMNFPRKKTEKVMHCIICHRFRTGNEPRTIEAKILFDADKLDTLGAVGIARLFVATGKHDGEIYSDVPVEKYIADNLIGGKTNGRIKDYSKHAPNMDYSTKLVHISKKLYTKKAKEIAQERLDYMKEFFERLKKEVKGNV